MAIVDRVINHDRVGVLDYSGLSDVLRGLLPVTLFKFTEAAGVQ